MDDYCYIMNNYVTRVHIVCLVLDFPRNTRAAKIVWSDLVSQRNRLPNQQTAQPLAMHHIRLDAELGSASLTRTFTHTIAFLSPALCSTIKRAFDLLL